MKTFRQIIEYNSQLGHTYVPNSTVRLRYGNDAYFIVTDAYGFRNSPKKQGAKKTIILLGDSFTAGDGVANEERFSDVLEELLDCTIINLGVSGYGVDQQILAYEALAEQIPHDGVLLTPHLDDWARNLMKSREGFDKSTGRATLIPKPYFEFSNGELILQNVPVPLERVETNPLPEEAYPNIAQRTKNYVERRILKRHLHPELSDPSSEEWKIMNGLLQRLIEKVGARPLMVAPFPFYDSVTYAEEPHFLEVLDKLVSNTAKTVDLVRPLNRVYAEAHDTWFLPLCGHFTPKAHRFIAETLSPSMQDFFGLAKRTEKTVSFPKEPAVYALGISCFYHDSAAALLRDGKIIAAAQEERFTRVKHDKSFPDNAINYCLEEAGIGINELTSVVYYDYETWTIERVLHNVEVIGDKGQQLWNLAKESLYTKLKLPTILRLRSNYQGPIFKSQHHVSHAAGAFYPSPFEDAAILVIDGVGEWACSTIAVGEKNSLRILAQQHYPHSLGLLYSAFTYFCGFRVNSGEYKLMGLAPYGKPIYADTIRQTLVDIQEDGSIFLNMAYFSFLEGEAMTNQAFADLFGGEARSREAEITRREMDLAASIQAITEEIVIKMARHAFALTGKKNLVMSGGVALNCVSNGKLFDETPFEDFYFQPASGDAGGAEGCVLNWYFETYPDRGRVRLDNSYLGPAFSKDETLGFLETKGLAYHVFEKGERAETIAQLLAEKNIIGLLDGRMEFGPRALGNRSIIADSTDVDMQSKLNLKIKFRESFRPFAPIYAEERTSDFFDFDRPSPYMLVVRKVKEKWLIQAPSAQEQTTDDMIAIVNQKRSELPAITHVDNSARLQSVNATQNPRFHDVLMAFERRCGKAVLINTSFNVRGEPIVCNLNDAYKCFMRTNMDVLVLNDFYLIKSEQANWHELEDWQETFELD